MTQVVEFSVRDLGKHGHEVTCRAEVLEEKGERRDTICGHYPDKQDAIRAACVEYMKRNLFSLGFVVVEAKEAKVENRIADLENRIADLEKINKDLADKLAESNSKVRHLNTVCDSKASAYVSLEKAFSKKSAELFEKETALDTTRKELESLRRSFRSLGGIA